MKLFSFFLLLLVLVDTSSANIPIDTIVNIVETLGLSSMSKLSDSVPELNQVESDHIEDCYSSAVGNGTIDVFAGNAGLIIHQIVTEFKDDIFPTDDLHSKIKTIVKNLSKLAKLIKKCVDSPPEERTKVGLTSFSTKSEDELPKKNLASVLSSKHHSIECIVDYSPDELPDEFSWVDQGVVTSVKNQGHCGSCYAFAAISALESQYLIHYEDDNVDLSEQAMIDCVSNGCSGGHSYNVYDYIKEEGVPEEEEVPYLEEDDECTSFESVLKIKNYCYSKGLSDDEIRAALYKLGPASISVYTGDDDVIYNVVEEFNGPCGSDTGHHAITLVGYTTDHWILKNSWGKHWGDDGFFKVKRGENKCGINRHITIPILE